jgi:hypothetical protein
MQKKRQRQTPAATNIKRALNEIPDRPWSVLMADMAWNIMDTTATRPAMQQAMAHLLTREGWVCEPPVKAVG